MPPVCKKCGGKIDPKGNYCMECLQTVHTVDNQDPIEEARPLPMKAIAIAAGSLLLLVFLWIYVATRPLPPERVAEEWVNQLLSYRITDAMEYTTERYEASATTGSKGASYDRADEFKDAVTMESATYAFSKPEYSEAGGVKMCTINVTFTLANSESLGYDIILVLQPNRHWLIDRVD